MDATERYLIIAVEQSDSAVGFYDCESGAEVGRVDVGFWPHEIEVSPDGRTLYVSNFGIQDYDETIGRPGASISVIDVEHRCEVTRLYTYKEPYEYPTRRAPHGVKLSPDGFLYVNVEQEPRMLVFDPSDLTRVTPVRSFSMTPVLRLAEDLAVGVGPAHDYPLPEGTHNFLFNQDGTRLFVVAGSNGIAALDHLTGDVLYHRSFESPCAGSSTRRTGRTSSPRSGASSASSIRPTSATSGC